MRRLVGLWGIWNQCGRSAVGVGMPLSSMALWWMQRQQKKVLQLQVRVVSLSDSMLAWSIGIWIASLDVCYVVHGQAYGFLARQVC